MQSNIVLTEQHIDDSLKSENGYKEIMAHVEKVIAEKDLIKTYGNKSAAALLIGVSRCKLKLMLK